MANIDNACGIAEDMIAKLMGSQAVNVEASKNCNNSIAVNCNYTNSSFIFDTVEDAIAAANEGYKALGKLTLAERADIIENIRLIAKRHAEELCRIEIEETGMGRYEDKVRKLYFVADMTPSIEDIKPEAIAGDFGLTVIEHIPFGVACCITPSTGPVYTAFHNAICMIAAGNSIIFSPHPNALKSSIKAIKVINDAILEVGGPEHIINVVGKSSFEITNKIIEDPSVKLIVATGGPGIVNKVLSSGKKAIGAGDGNPPVMVDETADLVNAARCIVAGSHFENGIQCICEKEIIVVDSVASQLVKEMEKCGAFLISNQADIERLTGLVTTSKGPNKDWIGKDPYLILKAIGIDAPRDTKTIIFEAPRDHIIANEEYLMPIIPIIRCKDADEAIELSVFYEGGRGHTAIIHSKNISTLTKFVKAIRTTIVVKNGPSYAGIGIGGEGDITATVAGPTGEGITSPKTFTRMQKCVLVGDFNLRGTYPL